MAILEITDPEGGTWEIEDNGNPQEAGERFKQAWQQSRPASQVVDESLKDEPVLRGVATAIKTALPVDAVENLGNVAFGRKPAEMGNLWDIAQLALAGAPGTAGLKGLKGAAAGSAAAGVMAGGLEVADVKSPVARLVLPLVAGIAAGNLANPVKALKPVARGQEFNALSRAVRPMGINVPEIGVQHVKNAGPTPSAARAAWEGTISQLGEKVGETKQAALQTDVPTREIVARLMGAGQEGLKKSGVPALKRGLAPQFSQNPAAAELVLNQLKQIGAIPKNVPPAQALELANNVLESAARKVAESGKLGESLSGHISRGGLDAIQGEIDALSNQAALPAHKAANAVFSKGKTLQEMVEGAAKGKGAGEAPGFRAKDFLALWQGMDNAEKNAKFLPEEIAAIDALTGQTRTLTQKAIQAVPALLQKFGLRDLAFHPATRFHELQPTTFNVNALAPAGAGTRASSYDPSQDPDVQRAQAAMRASRLSKVK